MRNIKYDKMEENVNTKSDLEFYEGDNMIQWKDAYKLEVEVIDAQHKRLFDLTQEAEELLNGSEYMDKYDEIIRILNELREYVKYHFEEEEKILFKIQYKEFFKHKICHNDFVSYIYDLDLEYLDLNQNESILKLLNKLNEWLIEHVLVEDRAWVKVYQEIN